MRLVFAGTPEFAARALAALLDAGHDVPLVLSQPDRPAGRGLHPSASAVSQLAATRGLEIFQPQSLKDVGVLDRLAAARPEVLVVAAYGLIVPPRALEVALHGAINIHASLLPRWRGAAPIQRALLAGDRESGITIMQMDAGLDTGPILSLHRMEISKDDDAQSLHDGLAALGAKAVVDALADIAAGRATLRPQTESGAIYARKIGKEEAELDWTRPCEVLERTVRALRPSPGARSQFRGEAIKIWGARCIAREGSPGEVIESGDEGILIACGGGALLAKELQRAGGKRLAAAEFLRGFPLARGERFGAAR
ncbi:MAG: methionyl-tRNA formyltransferase [Betaproteobacteria bacterium]